MYRVCVYACMHGMKFFFDNRIPCPGKEVLDFSKRYVNNKI